MSSEKKLPFNHEPLLKEYELKFNYTMSLSSRALNVVSAHMVFMGACLVAISDQKVGSTQKLAIAIINILLALFVGVWVGQIINRHKNTITRISEIASLFSIMGYHESSSQKSKIGKLTPIFAVLWFFGVVVLWIIMCIVT